MGYLGSRKINDTLVFTVDTHDPTNNGAATDADSVPTYRVYEDETATPIITGSMAKLDDANTTGFYSEQITLSAVNGLEKGKSYNIYIEATVSSIKGTISHHFQIEAEVDANTVSSNVDLNADQSGVTIGTTTTNTDMRGTDNALLAASAPTNFGDLSITASTGKVTVGTNDDKTGYALVLTLGFDKNTAVNNFLFPMFDGNGELTTGKTVTAQRVLDDGSFTSMANSVVEVGSGFYRINIAASDINGNAVAFLFTASGARATTFSLKPNA